MSGVEGGYRRWLAKAENDLLNIRNNLRAKTVPWDTVLYYERLSSMLNEINNIIKDKVNISWI